MSYVAVIGSGIMAAGIAAGFIAKNIPVVILARNKEKAAACLDKAISLSNTIKNSNSQDTVQSNAAHHVSENFDSWAGWAECSWVIETITENLELKKALFKQLDQLVPPHISIGSNSSGFPITKIAEGLPTANRMMGAHYFMPAEVVPLVEIVLGEKTALQCTEQVCELYRAIDKKPVLVKKDIPGFLEIGRAHV